MGWLKTDYDFGMPYAHLTIGRRQLDLCVKVRNALQKPDELEAALLKLIEFHRPNLRGGTVCGIRMNMGEVMFVIEYCHPSLPRTTQMCEPQRIPLIPEEVRQGHLMIVDEAVGVDDPKEAVNTWGHRVVNVMVPTDCWNGHPVIHGDPPLPVTKADFEFAGKRMTSGKSTRHLETVATMSDRAIPFTTIATFMRNGVKVDEAILKAMSGAMRVTWARSPISLAVVDGRPNPMFYAECDAGPGTEDGLRDTAARAFDEYWSNPEGQTPKVLLMDEEMVDPDKARLDIH